MNTKLLRKASRDGLGCRLWIVGDRDGRHVKITLRPLSALPDNDYLPWMAAAYNWRMADHFAKSGCHTAFFSNGRLAFKRALEHIAPIG